MIHPTPAEIDMTLPARVIRLEQSFACLQVFLEREANRHDRENAMALRFALLELLMTADVKIDAIRRFFADAVPGG